MRDPTPQTIQLRDYAPPAFLIPSVALDIALFDDHAQVEARLRLQRNPAHPDPGAPLVLDGEDLELISVTLDGQALYPDEYRLDEGRLTLPRVPDAFDLTTVCKLRPRENTRLMGLYNSKDGYFTQCEAEGFRRITFFLDRPDVMARYATTIHADKTRYPWLLSNGNPVDYGDENYGRHWMRWEDPFPKPCYLFAMVAANLEKLEEPFITGSGRLVSLQVYVEPGRLDQAGFALQALKKAMRWDEERFGLELDLDQYMIVAVGDFNMGAMENKGLNIFNTKYVLARQDTATDADFQAIDRVVAHEYFHNWTGNRVTCRDWFQLSLKEGLTVFRDQEFGADTYSRPVVRIQEVRRLRAAQFPEDAGPMAHPVRPQSYVEINNFYTPTVYEKGAEVVRMIHTLLGREGFRRGMDLYFKRHDGQAVTTDDFVQCMQDASGVDLAQFRRWYDQAGTPVLEVTDTYDPETRRYTLTVRQSCPPTPGQPDKLPFHIPLVMGLVDATGHDLPLRMEGEPEYQGSSRVLSIREAEQQFTFLAVPARPLPSLLRGFSAPVILRYPYSEANLAHLMAHDRDPFCRWEASQRLATELLLQGVSAVREGQHWAAPESFIRAFAKLLALGRADPAFAAEAMALPSEHYLAEQMEEVDPDALHAVRDSLARQLAASLRPELLSLYHGLADTQAYSPDAASAGRRSLRNLCLAYLVELDDSEVRELAVKQLELSDNMTDALAALTALANCDCDERIAALASFYAHWQHEPLVVDKWLRAQSSSRMPDALEAVQRLTGHPAFTLRNPNKVYALLGGFALANHVRFHAADGRGYDFMAGQIIELDRLNPQVASRLVRAFDRWRHFEPGRRAHAQTALERIAGTDGMSRDVLEVVTKALA